MTAKENLSGSEIDGATGSAQSAPQFLLGGFIVCPYCNHDDKIQLISLYTAIDERVFLDSELPNTYVVSIVRCNSCGLKFNLPRVDVRFGMKRGE
jgi:transcription elongation factor Elf1